MKRAARDLQEEGTMGDSKRRKEEKEERESKKIRREEGESKKTGKEEGEREKKKGKDDLSKRLGPSGLLWTPSQELCYEMSVSDAISTNVCR